MKLTGAQILMEVLKEEKVSTIFGYPGGAVIDIYDALAETDIRHVLVRHEQGAVHAADGYSRAAGQVGVCLVTSGPGVTNTVTGIASAYMDSIPIVVLSGQVDEATVINNSDSIDQFVFANTACFQVFTQNEQRDIFHCTFDHVRNSSVIYCANNAIFYKKN